MEFFLGIFACFILWAGDGYDGVEPSYKLKATGYFLVILISLSGTIERIKSIETGIKENERNFTDQRIDDRSAANRAKEFQPNEPKPIPTSLPNKL